MKHFIELANRVFEAEILPDEEGVMKRTCTITLASGKPLEDEKWEEVRQATMRDLERMGWRIHGSSFIREEA